MRITFALLLLVGASVSSSGQTVAPNQTEAVNPPFQLEITANLDKEHTELWDFVNSAETTVKAGSMVVDATRKTNISHHEINKSSGARGGTDIRDSSGNLIRPREFGSKPRDGIGGGEMKIRGEKEPVLKPGESKVDPDCVSDWYDLSQPGTYTIQVWEHTSNDPASSVVKSNIVTITVLPAEEPLPTKQQ